jgi:alkanesulfonate monooxygenase SsuD/methylene tetrahydromethanopterin reductase-like flavin-dependent oxidoreductase (luciferase family)
MWIYVTDDRAEAERVLLELLVPALNRPADELRDRLPIGPPEECAEKLAAYARAGAQRIFVWPLADDIRQIEAFTERVAPLVEAMA